MKKYSILKVTGEALIIEASDIEILMVKYRQYGQSEVDILSITIISK